MITELSSERAAAGEMLSYSWYPPRGQTRTHPAQAGQCPHIIRIEQNGPSLT